MWIKRKMLSILCDLVVFFHVNIAVVFHHAIYMSVVVDMMLFLICMLLLLLYLSLLSIIHYQNFKLFIRISSALAPRELALVQIYFFRYCQ